jgi:hypothetical protein
MSSPTGSLRFICDPDPAAPAVTLQTAEAGR